MIFSIWGVLKTIRRLIGLVIRAEVEKSWYVCQTHAMPVFVNKVFGTLP
jgi:hypothetical protein